ncbi:hypothetical protein SUDANB95_07894 (plasmid) [Actinosynnema sp. ALI-1.44]
MTVVALLPPAEGVLVRADTAAGVDVRLIELATKHGWTNTYFDDAVLTSAGQGRVELTAELEDKLARAGREALDWLEGNALPDGYELVNGNDVVVLARIEASR